MRKGLNFFGGVRILLKVNIICLGKLKEKYIKDGIAEYTKRLSRFCNLNIIELPDEKIPDNATDGEMKKVISLEGEKIKKHISDQSFKIALCVEGKQLSSEDFASKINNVTVLGKSEITFVIGGSLGLSEDIKKMCDMRLSFSMFTYPHMLMRLILVEQIYRAFKINSGEEYHK